MRSNTLKSVLFALGTTNAATMLDEFHEQQTEQREQRQQPDVAQILDHAQEQLIGELNNAVDHLAGALEEAHTNAKDWWQYRTSIGSANLSECEDYRGRATDTYGDGCLWYRDAPTYCGNYDDEDFTASTMCCACMIPVVEADCVDGTGTDSFGDGCNWYTNSPNSCGSFDTPDFIASEQCCACKDTEPRPSSMLGIKPKIPAILAAKAPMNMSGAKKTVMLNMGIHDKSLNLISKMDMVALLQERQDSAHGALDSYNDDCEWYSGNQGSCGNFDDEDFVAGEMCVACGGGELRFTATDVSGDGCDWYEGRTSSCGLYDDDDFQAIRDCYQCADVTCPGGQNTEMVARDTGGDGCDWYIGNEGHCGYFDDNDFHAQSMCCACWDRPSAPALNLADFPGVSKTKLAVLLASKGPEYVNGMNVQPFNLAQQSKQALLLQQCTNNDDEGLRVDRWGDGCSWYANHTSMCGDFDTPTFHADTDCCACGGGTGTDAVCEDTDRVDTFGDNCAWYAANPASCGNFDHEFFTAEIDCCACRPTQTGPTLEPVRYVSNLDLEDDGGDTCTWYADHRDECGNYDTLIFIASLECVECGGGLCIDGSTTAADRTGDTCVWYREHPSSCGSYDDEDFKANEMCCACQNQNQTAEIGLNLNAVLPKKQVPLILQTQPSCNDTAFGFDSAFDGCEWYSENPHTCGLYDDEDFEANRDCCACGGGTDSGANIGTDAVCEDSTRIDSFGDNCAYYTANPDSCGNYDHDFFTAAIDCCACRHTIVPTIQPVRYESNYELTDFVGDTCAWYKYNSQSCGGWDSPTFNATHECAECGGGTCIDGSTTATDQTGDTCEWYWRNPESCGSYDDEDFKANEMCCACQGERTHDRSGGATDSYDDGCAWYAENPGSCGDYDDEDFTANTMCGACFYRAVVLTGLKAPHPMVNLGTDNKFGLFTLAGSKKIPLNLESINLPKPLNMCIDTNGEGRDSGNDSCSWYNMNSIACGSYDDSDFRANEMCCACNGGRTETYEPIVDEEVQEAVAEIVDEFDDVETVAELEEVLEEVAEEIVEEVEEEIEVITHPELTVTEAEASVSDEYRPLKDIIELLDFIGQDPDGYVTMAREGLIQELRSVVEVADAGLTEAKREILREITQPYLLSEFDDAQDMLASLNGGLNLEAQAGPLSAPEWTIDVDHAAGEQMASEIEQEYEEWEREAEEIWEDWQRDREIVDRYYWRYEMEPHLESGSKLDEKAMRKIVTFIAEGTQVKGRPLIEVFPEVEELMMSRYNASEPSPLEQFGVFNLQEAQEWPHADWEAYQECVAEANFTVEAAREDCIWLDTYNNDFARCIIEYDCRGYDAFIERYPTGRVEETSAEDFVHELEVTEQAIEEAIDPRGGAVVYSLYFDEQAVTQYMENQATVFTNITQRFVDEVNSWQQAMDQLDREHAPRFEELHHAFRAQAESSVFRIEEWLVENASVERVSTVSLAARIENRSQPKVTSSELFMYASVAIASVVAVIIQVQQMRKREVDVADVYERLV